MTLVWTVLGYREDLEVERKRESKEIKREIPKVGYGAKQ